MPPTDRSLARPPLRPACAAERPDRPGPARRRLPGLDPRQGPAAWPIISSPAATSTATTGLRSRRWSARHLKKHGGDPEKSLAAVSAGRSTRESLARVGDAEIEASLAHLGPASTQAGEDADRTASYAVGTATSDGQRFRVLRPHARGGLGAVFVALDDELHREVALKQILDRHADDPISRQRFLLEAEITGGLEHPGIVPVYGLGTYGDGRPYYAMRFIRGDQPQGGHRAASMPTRR